MERINPRNAIQFRRPPLIAFALFAISTGQLTVDRRNQNLIAIPEDINPNVTILQLGSNHIARVEEGDLAGLLRLEEIYIGHNETNFISQAAFVNNKKLLKIVMSSFTLPEFRRRVVVHCKSRYPQRDIHQTDYNWQGFWC